MEHAREIELIELVARRLDPKRKKAVLTHVQDCPVCRTKLEGIKRTWTLLGAWQVQPARHMEMATLADSPRSREKGDRASIIRFPGVATAARIAATIAVAVLAGYASGRWSIHLTPPVSGAQPPQYVSVLGLEMADSFSPLVLQDEPSSGQEG